MDFLFSWDGLYMLIGMGLGGNALVGSSLAKYYEATKSNNYMLASLLSAEGILFEALHATLPESVD